MFPKKITRDAIKAYEHRSGFFGLGAFLEQKGRIKIVDGGKEWEKAAD